jgi:hypothetical protein
MRGFFLFALSICLPLQHVYAERPSLAAGQVRVEGLTFNCPSCSRQDDSNCIIPQDGKERLVACDDAIEFLLKERVNGEYDLLHPSATELRNYLLNDGLSYSRRRASFELLFKSKSGQQEVIKHAGSLYGLHYDIFEELINEGLASKDMLEHLWSMPLGSDRRSARLRTIIAHAHPSYSLEKLFNSLSAVDLLKDEHDIAAMASLLRLLGSSWAMDVELAQSVFPQCGKPIQGISCDLAEIEKRSGVVARYFEKVISHLTLRQIADTETAPDTVLSTIAQLPYERVRTPDMLELIVEAVVSLENEQGYWQSCSQDIFRMLATVGEHDDQLASLLHALLAEPSFEQSIARVEMSEEFAVYKTGYSELYARSRLAGSMKSEEKQGKIAWLLFFSASLSALLFYAYRRWFADERVVNQGHALSSEERAELRSLRKYFKIAPGAKNAELAKRFRVLARRLHPDVDGGSNHAFTELGEKYNRAQELLKRLHSV